MRATSQIRVSRVGSDFAYVSIVCEGWSIGGIEVRNGRISWPTGYGKRGGRFAVAAPPPELRDQLEEEIAEAVEGFGR